MQNALDLEDREILTNKVAKKNTSLNVIHLQYLLMLATYFCQFQFLPIPELMPLRLTRQLRNLMMPLQVHGLMESTMIHTLRALRNNCDLLLNTMDIFVKEPSVDWLVRTLYLCYRFTTFLYYFVDLFYVPTSFCDLIFLHC